LAGVRRQIAPQLIADSGFSLGAARDRATAH
jgi:hypothetical protein